MNASQYVSMMCITSMPMCGILFQQVRAEMHGIIPTQRAVGAVDNNLEFIVELPVAPANLMLGLGGSAELSIQGDWG
jgi:hypothetical protein